MIRLKHIYNFCLFHPYIGDIAICFATLSYLLQHIWTNLLTQCQFLSAVVHALQENVKYKSARKNPEKSDKKSAVQKNPKARRRAGGGPPPGQAPTWRGQGGGRATWLPGQVGPPLGPPFLLYITLDTETLEESPVTRFRPLFHRRRDSNLGISRRTCPGTLPEGGLTSGDLSITMIVSGMCHE